MTSVGSAPRVWPNRLRARAHDVGPELLALAVAVIWFFHLGYGAVLSPSHTAWLLRDDWAAYYWGFAFFREAPLAWPLGAVPDLFYPFGTSVAFTDSNPLVSLVLRPFSALLPHDFQPFGAWLLLCFAVQALVGVRIARHLLRDPTQIALGGSLFALTPLLPSRNAHLALCGFFFVLAGVGFHFTRTTTATAPRQRAMVLLWLFWAAGTHGYLSAMLLTLSLAWCWKLCAVDAIWSAQKALLSATAMIAITLVTYFVFGYVGWKPTELAVEGFGDFSGDLAAFFDPMGWSRFWGSLPHRGRQWEGFTYLGTGPLCLVVLSLVLWLRRARAALRGLRRFVPLLVALLAMYVYSLSSRVTFLGEEVLSLESLYAPLSALTGIFRSSGRFSWPLHFALIAAGVSAAGALRGQLPGRVVLLGALALQALELDPSRLHFEDVVTAPLRDPVWRGVGDAFRHVQLVPTQIQWLCPFDQHVVNRFSELSYSERLTFNSGNFMRKDRGAEALCNRHVRRDEPLDRDTIYVVSAAFLADFSGRAGCWPIDGVTVCVANEARAKFRRPPALP